MTDCAPLTDPLGFYVHVPFCRSKCRYCDFCSHPPQAGEMDRYARALESEIRLRRCDRPVSSVYIGGGTPSFLETALLQGMLDSIRKTFCLVPDCEITVEANPADITADWLAACREAGVNRLSLGVQAMRDDDLRFLGRRHTVAEAVAAGRRVRDAGFGNLGIDVIVGLPGHSAQTTAEILRRAVSEFAPEHISCYQLTVAPHTPLHRAVERSEVAMPDADGEAQIFMATHETLAALGYEGYEVSNFAQSRTLRSRHNSAYWTHSDYLGFGPSAHSFINPIRSWNAASLAKYCSSLDSSELPVEGRETLNNLQRAEEIILLGLRTRDGFSLDRLRSECGVELVAEKGDALKNAESEGFLRHRGERIVPTLSGMAIADRLAVDLAPDVSSSEA